ncbi:MAG: calcium-binding protein, partial [Spirulina sp. SIO3F2]|nr:calcium-binding protein [Spirulina sp. SIO3F2]
GNDKIRGEDGNDSLSGDAGRDYIHGGDGSDAINGGADADKLVGGRGTDVIQGGAGDDHIWGGNWSGDNASDTFVFAAGSGKDIIHDFETDQDQIDLTSYGLDYDSLQNVMTDHGWAVELRVGSVSLWLSGYR